MEYRGRRVLVLGASGFIGRWVARHLTSAGADLVLAVRDPAAARALAAPYRIRGEILPVDLESPGSVGSLVSATLPAIVFNLAGYGVDSTERDATRSRRINADVVGELLEALHEHPAADWPGLRLVHTGSALEYGEVGGDLDEAGIARPTTLYGSTKLLGTQLVAQAVAAGSLAAVTARLFTVYGPGEHRGRLLPTLLDAAGGDTLIPLTTGEQRRDFTYVEDVAAGLLRLGLSSSSPYPIVNLATGKLYQVKEFVLTAARILRIPVGRLGFGVLPSRSTDMIHSAVRIRRIRQMLGWAPSTDITVGISRTAEFVQREARPALPEGGRDGV